MKRFKLVGLCVLSLASLCGDPGSSMCSQICPIVLLTLSVMKWTSGHVGSMILCLVFSSDDRGFSISRWHHYFRVAPSPSNQGLLCFNTCDQGLLCGSSRYYHNIFLALFVVCRRAVFLSHFSRGVGHGFSIPVHGPISSERVLVV